MNNIQLENICRSVRSDILNMSYKAGIGHIGSALSTVEILTTLYFGILNINPKKPNWKDRDRFILSKGHAAASFYSVLARKGFFSQDKLATFCQENSQLIVHPEFNGLSGIDFASGSLGHGLSVATGIAYGAKLLKKSFKVFVLVSDAEINEGSVWEAAMFAGHKKIGNLFAILDYNHSQGLGKTENILDLEPLIAKWKAFNFETEEVDGHDLTSIAKALKRLTKSSKPKVLIAKTKIGKGVSFMEGDFRWHYYNLTKEQYNKALHEVVKTT